MTARDTVLTRLLALNDAATRWLTARDALLPLLARLTFAAVLLRYFWVSALTKIEGFGIGLNAYAQIFPRRVEAAGYDHTALPFWADLVVAAGTLAEFILPALIVLGLMTRGAALGMAGFIAVQSLTDLYGHGGIAHAETLGALFDKAPDGVILDQRALWLMLLAVLVVKGGGYLSADRLLRNAIAPRPAFQPQRP